MKVLTMYLAILIRTTITKSYLAREEDYRNKQSKYLSLTEYSIFKGLEKRRKVEGFKS